MSPERVRVFTPEAELLWSIPRLEPTSSPPPGIGLPSTVIRLSLLEVCRSQVYRRHFESSSEFSGGLKATAIPSFWGSCSERISLSGGGPEGVRRKKEREPYSSRLRGV